MHKMKQLLLWMLLFISMASSAQWQINGTRFRSATGIGIPVKDSSFYSLGGDTALIYIGTDGKLYYKFKTWHNRVATNNDIGIYSLNGLNGSTQTFSKVDDTNVTLAINSSGSNHAFTLGWAGTLADSRIASAANWNAKFTLPSLTSGSVLFSNGSTISQNNANFFWDNTNTRLGLGTTSPSYQLHVNGPSTTPQFAIQSTVSPFGVTTFSVNNLGNLTISTNNSVLSMGTSVVDAAMLTSGLRTYATTQQLGNFYSPLGQQNSGAFTDATLLIGGASAIRARNIMNGQLSSSTLANGEAGSNLLLGSIQYQTANSSVVPLLTNLAVRKQTNHVLGSGASVTNTASLYVEGAGAGTVTGSNYAIWSAAGSNRFDGDLTVKTIANGTAGTDSLLVENAGVVKKISPAYYSTSGGGGGGVTSVATGLGLSGGPITTTGTVVLDTASAVVLSRQRAANTYQPIGSYLTANQNITVTATGDATGTSSSSPTAPSIALTVSKINGTSLAGLATGILKNTTATGVPSIAVAADFPTLNQNTTGTAANVTATSNSSLTTLSALSLPGSQVSGNISGNAANVTGTVAIGNGGTGQTSATAAYDALSPNSTLGDIAYRGASNNVRLAGNTTTTKKFLAQTGNGTVSAAPSWDALTATDIPSLDASKITTGSFADAQISSAAAWNAKQAALVSGTNIKSVNGSSLLGSGNLAVGDALVANPLSQFAATTSAQLATVLSDETGTGNVVYSTSPTLVTPALGTPSAIVLTNATGLPESAITQYTKTHYGTSFNTTNTIGASTTNYLAIQASGATNATENNRLWVVPESGTLRNLYVGISSTQSATGSLVFTIRKGTVGSLSDQAFTLTIAAGSTAGVYSNTSSSLSVTAGDVLSYKIVNNATATSAGIVVTSIILTN